MLSGDAIWNLGWTFIDLSPLEKLSRICEKVRIGSSDPGPLTGSSDVIVSSSPRSLAKERDGACGMIEYDPLVV
jgi:hypothetical protein